VPVLNSNNQLNTKNYAIDYFVNLVQALDSLQFVFQTSIETRTVDLVEVK